MADNMSQNRQAAKDRLEAHYDFLINQKTEEEVRVIMEHLEAQNRAITEIYQRLFNVQTVAETPSGN